jgi:hypothetical protein
MTKKRTIEMPHGLGVETLGDLVKHTTKRVDQLYGDMIDLTDDPFDAFKLGAALTATVLRRFGHTIDEIMPDGLLDMPSEARRRHAWIDCLNALSTPLDTQTPRERMIGTILEACICIEYSKPGPTKDRFAAKLEQLLADLKK